MSLHKFKLRIIKTFNNGVKHINNSIKRPNFVFEFYRQKKSRQNLRVLIVNDAFERENSIQNIKKISV